MVRPLAEKDINSGESTGKARPSAKWIVNGSNGRAEYKRRICSIVIRSKPLLTLEKIFHQRFVEAHARIHRHVINVRFGTLSPIHFTKIADRAKIIRPHAAGV